jgi:hypothetical protein
MEGFCERLPNVPGRRLVYARKCRRLPVVTNRLSFRRQAAVLLAVALALAPMRSGATMSANAAELDGVTLPDMLQAAGTPLRLNGIGMRTFSLFRIHIYVAALYLQQPTSDAEAILRSDAIKLLDIHFVHDVDAIRARDAWMTGFRDNCRAPCHLPAAAVERFLGLVPDFHKGDSSTLLFNSHSAVISVNGRVLGTVDDAAFSRAILATFIGVYPPTEPLKHGLLGLQN